MKKLVILIALSIPSLGFASIDINGLIRLTSQTKSIEEAIPKLPREYFENYVLIYNSNSAQKADPLRPRVVLYGNGKTGLTFSFSSIPISEGGGNSESFEAIQFNRSTKKFEFYDISYSGGGSPKVTKNPPECMGCHRQELRPNWAKFDSWAGVYGSQSILSPNSNEMANFKKFVEIAPTSTRYSKLVGLTPDARKYLDRKPAETLQLILSEQNNQRIAKLVTELPLYEKYKYAIAGAADNAGEIETYIPEILKEGKTPYKDVLEDTLARMAKFHVTTVKRQQLLLGNSEITEKEILENPRKFPNWDLHRRADVIKKYDDGYTYDRHAEKVAKLRYVIENLMGANIESWGIGLNFQNFSLSPAGWDIDPSGRIPNFSEHILDQDREIKMIIFSKKGSERAEALQALSLKSLSSR